MNRMEQLLKDFDRDKLRQINDFLSTSDGMRLKKQINNADKDRLIREFSNLNSKEVQKRLAKLNPEDIKRIMNNL